MLRSKLNAEKKIHLVSITCTNASLSISRTSAISQISHAICPDDTFMFTIL